MVALRKSEFAHSPPLSADLPPREEISSHLLIDELRLVGGLIERAVFTEDERRRTADLARRLVMSARANRAQHSGIDAFMHEYGLSSEEGVILMCLAEALLRIPDAETADKFIAEKIAGGHWERHLGHSGSLFVNASTWGLMLTGRIVKLRESQGANPMDSLKRLVARHATREQELDDLGVRLEPPARAGHDALALGQGSQTPLDLLRLAATARLPLLPQRLVFHRVPADAHPEAQTPAAQDIDLRRLLDRWSIAGPVFRRPGAGHSHHGRVRPRDCPPGLRLGLAHGQYPQSESGVRAGAGARFDRRRRASGPAQSPLHAHGLRHA